MNEALQSRVAEDVQIDRAEAAPCFFGRTGAELFGWIHGRVEGTSGRVGVVLCGTLGIESLSTHRAIRILAESLADQDMPTVRFDYAGTGDSVDPPGVAVGLSAYVENVRTAIQAIKAQDAVDRVVLVGVRLGALFAMKAAELEEVSGLVLWGPVVSGKRFVREWNMLAHSAGLPARPADDGSVHAAGFSLRREFLDELALCNLLQAQPRGTPGCLVVEREELAPEDKLVGRLQELGLRTQRCRPGGFLAGMIPDPHLTEVPARAIQEIREWIAGMDLPLSNAMSAPAQVSLPSLAKAVLFPDVAQAGHAPRVRIRERFLDRDEPDDVFAIVSEPADPIHWNGQCVVLLNAGSVHHIGPNRMHVAFARLLAAQGSRVCRADLRGLGDSPVCAESRENDPYPACAVDDVGRIVRALRGSGGGSRIALVGLCSGAWASFHGALALDGITDIVLINPDFYGERSVVGKPASFVRPKDYSHYKHSARSWAKWRKLLMGRANVTKIIRVLGNQATLSVAAFRTRSAGGQHELDTDLIRLAASGVRVGFIFSPGDGGADFLRSHGQAGLERLRRSGLLREATIKDSDHPFSLPGSHVRLGETLSEWLR